ncbi:uncharacterized protein LOC103165044 isoform X2 [Ornithorhynchus anatinus]|uniref:uncharacterized protein LOC103165044 isoform X2 n=1 Tax=Ornithorhynchus anatinus TaxID=9258 RepID=UPI0010A92D3C|nr:uncharacterized protein LOC103165044 isoform X2 [Ornithorhynchus anatinus]
MYGKTKATFGLCTGPGGSAELQELREPPGTTMQSRKRSCPSCRGWTFNEDRLRRLLGDTPACSALITEAKSLFSREGPSHPESQPSSSHGHPKRGPRRPKEQSLGFDRAYSSSSSPSFYPSFSSCSCSSSSFYPSSSSYFSMSPTRSPRSVADPLPPSAAPRDEAGMEHQHEVIKQSLELQVLENTLRKQEDLARELREAPILVSAKEDGGQESREKTLCLKPSHISGKHGWLPSNIQDPITLLEVNVRQKYLAFLLGLHDFH